MVEENPSSRTAISRRNFLLRNVRAAGAVLFAYASLSPNDRATERERLLEIVHQDKRLPFLGDIDGKNGFEPIGTNDNTEGGIRGNDGVIIVPGVTHAHGQGIGFSGVVQNIRNGTIPRPVDVPELLLGPHGETSSTIVRVDDMPVSIERIRTLETPKERYSSTLHIGTQKLDLGTEHIYLYSHSVDDVMRLSFDPTRQEEEGENWGISPSLSILNNHIEVDLTRFSAQQLLTLRTHPDYCNVALYTGLRFEGSDRSIVDVTLHVSQDQLDAMSSTQKEQFGEAVTAWCEVGNVTVTLKAADREIVICRSKDPRPIQQWAASQTTRAEPLQRDAPPIPASGRGR